MSGWTSDELARIGQADELDLASQRRDGSLRDPVTMWVVRDGDDLYVRSMHGRAGAWFRGTQTRRQGHIRSGGVDRGVTFIIDTVPALNKPYRRRLPQQVPTLRGPHRRRCRQPCVTRLNDQARAALTTSVARWSGRAATNTSSGSSWPRPNGISLPSSPWASTRVARTFLR